jgi:hypothetical protein
MRLTSLNDTAILAVFDTMPSQPRLHRVTLQKKSCGGKRRGGRKIACQNEKKPRRLGEEPVFPAATPATQSVSGQTEEDNSSTVQTYSAETRIKPTWH